MLAVRYDGVGAVERDGIPQVELMEAIRRLPARKVVVLLDTCKSGALAEGLGTRGLAEKKALAIPTAMVRQIIWMKIVITMEYWM